MHSHEHHHKRPFGPEHASHYDAGATAGLVGYHAMHEVIAATMAVSLRGSDDASVLCMGVGTGQELLPYARYGAPSWRFTGLDTSPHMLAVARERLTHAGLLERTLLHEGELSGLHASPPFDGAQMVGVLHHVGDEAARLTLLREVTRRLKPGAPFVIAERIGADPVLLAAEEEHLRVAGASPEKLALRREAHASFDVPATDEAFFALLRAAGLMEPRQLFATLHFKAFLLQSAPGSLEESRV